MGAGLNPGRFPGRIGLGMAAWLSCAFDIASRGIRTYCYPYGNCFAAVG